MDYLEVLDGQGKRRRVPLDRPRLLIGREPSCDIQLSHPGVSRRHAQLQRTEQARWLLQDLRSRNHVYLDERPVQQFILEPNRSFRIAEYWITLQRAPLTDPEPGLLILDDTTDTGHGGDTGWLEQLQVFQRILLRQEEASAVLDRLAREYRRILEPQLVAVGLTGPQGYRWELAFQEERASGSPDLEDVHWRVTDGGVSSIQTWTADPGLDGPSQSSPPFCLLVPLKGRAGVIGHVYVSGPRVTPVPPPTLRYLSLLAGLAGLVHDNLQLGSARLTQLAMEKELHQARHIQTELFPPTFDIDPRLDAHAVNLPSAYVSGDYYDLIKTGPHTVAFVIADAMGHGMPAALLMAAVRSALRMGLSLGLPWESVFHGIDEVINQSRGDMFVTGIVGHLDLRDRHLTLVCAGHPPPSILVDGLPVAIPESCQTRPWGLDLEGNWHAGRLSLVGKNWSILMYTDGVTDAAVRAQRVFGAKRVAAYHAANHQRSAEDLCQGLLSEVAFNPGGAPLGDDQTVLVLRASS